MKSKRFLKIYCQESIKFGVLIEKSFLSNYSAHKFPDEIKQFEALIKSFNNRGESLATFNYHGKSSQVEFNPILNLTRINPRCELADVLFVSFTDTQLRITFLQAKSVDASHPFPLRLANVEQFALLSTRPSITNWKGKFHWSNNVLSDAILKSIGSFGIFYKHHTKKIDFAFRSADLLSARKISNGGKYVSGVFNGINRPYRIRGPSRMFLERTSSNCLFDFAVSLKSMSIGSPIHASVDQFSNMTNAGPASKLARQALLGTLRSVNNEIYKEEQGKSLLEEILSTSHFQNLEPREFDAINTAAIVIIKGQDSD